MSSSKREVPDELLSRLLAKYQKPEDLIGENCLLKQLTKLLVEKALGAEMTENLDRKRHGLVANAVGNTRNERVLSFVCADPWQETADYRRRSEPAR